MEIIIRIDEKTEDEYNRTFDLLKECARDNKPLPDDFEDDEIDLEYLERIKRVYINFKLSIGTKEDLQALGTRYRKKYIQKKAYHYWRLSVANEDLEKRKKTGQITKKMVTLDFDTYSQAESLLQKLFEITLDSVTAKELQRTFVQYLKTGCKPQKEVTDDDQHDNADGQACA